MDQTPMDSTSGIEGARQTLWGIGRTDVLLCLLILGVTVMVYGQTSHFDFVNYDDPQYVTDNRIVLSGWSREGLAWAFTTDHDGNWFPLTWLSHMTDVQLFGKNPGGHHLSSLVIHLINIALLMAMLKYATGAPVRSAIVAALFALHPLHVESVAWVAERKDVLSTLFGLLAMLLYVRSVDRHRPGTYLLLMVLFSFSLMAKPMLVTLPLLLFLLDFWPLGRFKDAPKRTIGWLFLEKLPFVLLSAMSAAITYAVQKGAGAVKSSAGFPLNERIGNAVVSYVAYLVKTIWPARLSVYYPHPGAGLPAWQIWGSVLILVTISIFVLKGLKSYPFLAMGWIWYVGTLIPVIGLVQVGSQAMADRYTYVPLTGIFIMVVWGGDRLLAGRAKWRAAVGVGVAAVLVAIAGMSFRQVERWQNSMTLFEHALKVTRNNYVACLNLGDAYSDRGRTRRAESLFRRALAIRPNDVTAIFNMGKILYDQGKIDAAEDYYKRVLAIDPGHGGARNNLANLLTEKGDLKAAERHYRAALRLSPESAATHHNLGNLLLIAGRYGEADAHFQKALALDSSDALFHVSYGILLETTGKHRKALGQFSESIRIRPDYPEPYYHIGRLLMAEGNYRAASRFFQQALRLRKNYAAAGAELERARSLETVQKGDP